VIPIIQGELTHDRHKPNHSKPNTAKALAHSLCGEEAVKSPISKRSTIIAGRKTSVSLEYEFWNSLKEIARERGMTLGQLVAAIDADRQHANLSSAIRLFVLGFYRDQRR
jgi:predicted DNA-binding ribbon-helix-helix protein